MNDLEPEDELFNTPLVSPFLDSDENFDDGEVLSELEEYGNAGRLYLMRRSLEVLRKFLDHDSWRTI
ncbi:hypothetical protein Tco_0174321 [Tanacetum coccineum]